MEPSELPDTAAFADVGLDSLISPTITGRMREELEIGVLTSLFVDKATVGEAKATILALDPDDSNEGASTSSGATTDATSGVEMTRNSSIGSGMEDCSTESTTEKILSTISEEIGVGQSEILEIGNFAVLALIHSCHLQLPAEFAKNSNWISPRPFSSTTLVSVMQKWQFRLFWARTQVGVLCHLAPLKTRLLVSLTRHRAYQKPNDQCLTNSIVQSRVNTKALPFATSILLSGNPKTASKNIFLFPYGSGSATPYAKLPSISKDVCIYALNSPFMKIPGDITNGIVAQYLAEIKRRQPQGP